MFIFSGILAMGFVFGLTEEVRFTVDFRGYHCPGIMFVLFLSFGLPRQWAVYKLEPKAIGGKGKSYKLSKQAYTPPNATYYTE